MNQRLLPLTTFISLCLFSMILFGQSAFASLNPQQVCKGQDLQNLPIQQGGRIKPLLVHANESLKFLTGSKSWNHLSATEVYCHLSLSFQSGLTSDLEITSPVDHIKVREFLKIGEEKKVPLKNLQEQGETIRFELQKIKVKDSYQKELEKIVNKIHLYQEIISGNNWYLPSFAENAPSTLTWVPLINFIEAKQIDLSSPSASTNLTNHFQEAKKTYINNQNDDYLLEVTYTKANLFTWAILFVLLSLGTLILFKKRKVGLILAGACIIIQVTGIIMRIIISGRAPITNMYETVMFSGFGALVLALLLSFMRKEKFFLIAGLSYNLCCLLMMNFSNNMLSSSIGPLVPVLRDNFWLSTHVTMVILSYAALALSWILANMVLLQKRFAPPGKFTNQDLLYYNSLIYSCLKFGIILLSAGVILGGIWADYSWGRFWGWDPKETWSLIVLLVYMIILHGKSTSWISPERFVFFTAGAFMSVMMAWFGVNYILAAGLHSYGFGQEGAVFLVSFFTVQILILLLTGINSPKTRHS